MLLHITPKIMSPDPLCNPHLMELEIKELGLKLVGEKDITTRKPYPNKQYHVACRKKSQKAVSGILIESPIFLSEYTVTSLWDWTGKGSPVTHIVKYTVLDKDFDMTSDDMLLWYGSSEDLGNWKSRWPKWADGLAPVEVMPCMDVSPHRKRQGEYKDEYDSISGGITKRLEVFRLPTIERERLLTEDLYPLPGFEMAFKVNLP